MNDAPDALSAEAIRLYRRYEREVVQSLALCPWAERARRDGRVAERVVQSTELAEAPALDAIAELAKDGSVDIGLLLFPRLPVAFGPFERFVSRLSSADAERRELGTAPFALAAFHPDAPLDSSDPERLIPFLRRTPDPTIQLVRVSALERVREGFNEGTEFVDIRFIATTGLSREDTLPLRERIARANHRTVTRLGVAELEKRFAAIRADRDAAYARLAAP
jgi:hypothetical protein